MMIRTLLPLLGCAIFVACSSSSSSSSNSPQGSGDGGTASDGGLELAAPPAGQGIQLQMQTTIAASTEDERCKFVQITEDMWVNQEVVRYTPGSHHFLLWHTPYTSIPTVDNQGNTEDTSGVVDCLDGPAGHWNVDGLLGGGQSPAAPSIGGDYPPGVALHIAAGSVVVMDLHVLNASTKPLNPTVLMNLVTIPKSEVKQEGGVYFFYNPFIRVPAGGKSSAHMSCPVTSDVTLVNGQTHMHKQGLGGWANLDDGTGAKLQQLYQTSLWTDPPVLLWTSPTMSLKAGQQIDYQCDYYNPGDTDVIQGLSAATNEMCVWTGAYYPRDTNFEYCNGSGGWNNLSNAGTYIGTGTADGATTLQCLSNADPSAASYNDTLDGCVVDSCPAVAKQLTAVFACSAKAGANANTACMTQFAALQQAACQ
jgi:hypothetical protein